MITGLTKEKRKKIWFWKNFMTTDHIKKNFSKLDLLPANFIYKLSTNDVVKEINCDPNSLQRYFQPLMKQLLPWAVYTMKTALNVGEGYTDTSLILRLQYSI